MLARRDGGADGFGGDPLYAAARPERSPGAGVADRGLRGRCRTPLRHRTVVRGGDGGGGCQTGKIITMFDVEKIRGEFPILGREVYGKPLVYLDSGATAQKPLAVIEMVDYLQRGLNANIHRGVHYLSEEATTLLQERHASVLAPLSARPKRKRSSLRPALRLRSIRWPMPGVKSSSVRATISLSARWSTTPISCPGRCSPNAKGRKSRPALRRRGAPVHRTAAVAAG